MNDNPPPPTSPPRPRPALNTLGVVVLLLGLAVAAIVYSSGHIRPARQSTANADWKDSTLSAADSKKSSRDIELYYGKIGLLVVKLRDWSQQPESLAIIIATISVLAASGCFLLANPPR